VWGTLDPFQGDFGEDSYPDLAEESVIAVLGNLC